jgi:flagellar biosynthesis protein FlhF
VAAFVGPTGVGKTTTIAKLAAALSFQKKMKVALISIDNYRVGAFEQLKAYASIMGLVCVPAFNSQDLSSALDRMKSMDMVLIDTAGHSHFDRVKIDEILQLIQTDFRISTHLVLSVTSESTIMKDAASAFSVFNPETLVFTKIDETRRCGKILDQVSDLKLPVSLIANGQRVPEDLIVPDKRQLLKIILGKEPKENN